MQLSELREALKITLPYSFAELAKKLDINEATLYRKLNGSNKFKARELMMLHKILLPTAPLTTFLAAYGFEEGTYEPLPLSLDHIEFLMGFTTALELGELTAQDIKRYDEIVDAFSVEVE